MKTIKSYRIWVREKILKISRVFFALIWIFGLIALTSINSDVFWGKVQDEQERCSDKVTQTCTNILDDYKKCKE